MARDPELVEVEVTSHLLDAILAIGVYSDEADPEAGKRHRRRTDVGARLNQAKYGAGAHTADEAFAALSEGLILIASAHPACAGATAVVATPGSDMGGESFSERLARDVALGLDVKLVTVQSRFAKRTAAKQRQTQRSGDYKIAADLAGDHVLVVDDVVATGSTLGAVAQAARSAGATTCVGLVAAWKLPS